MVSTKLVIPAKAGIQSASTMLKSLDSRFAPSLGLLRTSRGKDEIKAAETFFERIKPSK
jgi:hypothetical protein